MAFAALRCCPPSMVVHRQTGKGKCLYPALYERNLWNIYSLSWVINITRIIIAAIPQATPP